MVVTVLLELEMFGSNGGKPFYRLGENSLVGQIFLRGKDGIDSFHSILGPSSGGEGGCLFLSRCKVYATKTDDGR